MRGSKVRTRARARRAHRHSFERALESSRASVAHVRRNADATSNFQLIMFDDTGGGAARETRSRPPPGRTTGTRFRRAAMKNLPLRPALERMKRGRALGQRAFVRGCCNFAQFARDR